MSKINHSLSHELDNQAVVQPTAKYGAIVEAARGMLSGSRICKMFCNGLRCKHCDAVAHAANNDNALTGVSSSWINDDILAISRPTQASITDFNLLEQFKEHNVQFLINLQEAFEHASCGEGVLDCGFSYDSEQLMKSGVACGNFPWIDFGSPTKEYALDIVQVMVGVVKDGGKVAVHCHAGRGRTGLIIACYLIYQHRLSASVAIHTVRSRRAKTIQTTSQVKFVHTFANWINPALRPLDTRLATETTPLSLQQVLDNQKPYLHGQELRQYKHLPQLVDHCVTAIVRRISEATPMELDLDAPELDVPDLFQRLTAAVNERRFDQLAQSPLPVLLLFLFGWFYHLDEPAVDMDAYDGLDEINVSRRRIDEIVLCCSRMVASSLQVSEHIRDTIMRRLVQSMLQDPDAGLDHQLARLMNMHSTT